MSEYTVFGWQNENGLFNFPFSDPFTIQDLFVDASFIQFDNFIPVLKSVYIGYDTISVTMLFDCGEITEISGTTPNQIRFFQNTRYLGCLTLGAAANSIFTNFTGQIITTDLPVLPMTVRSIPSKDAVYTLDGLYGDVTFGALATDEDLYTEIGGIVYKTKAGGNTIFYNADTSLKSLTFNAVANHHIPENSGIYPLKKINLIPPTGNNIFISSNDIIKFNSINNQKLGISLAGESVTSTSIVPTLTT
jgi:hypothetical protein